MKNHWTHKECDMVISIYKNNTAFFDSDKPMTFPEMYDMLRLRMKFGEAETNIIIASLIKCGAKFIDEN